MKNKKESEEVQKYLGHTIVLKYKSDDYSISSWCTWNGFQILLKETVGLDIKKNRDHLDHSTVQIF